MRSRSAWATQQAIVGIVLIVMAAVLLVLSLQSGWAGPAFAGPASPGVSVSPRPVGGTAATDPATSGSAPGGPGQAVVTSSSRSSHATASSRPTTPLLLEVPAIALKAAITAYTPAEVAADAGAVKPPTLFSVSWWTGGGNPGPAARNTVYLYGHTWKEPAVFNRIKELRVGDRVVVTTTGGRLVYVVDGSFTVGKPDLVTTARVTQATPGRLLLIGCYRATGHEAHTTANIVVTTHLLPA
jgi:sortase (surface protein transpeptidase)